MTLSIQPSEFKEVKDSVNCTQINPILWEFSKEHIFSSLGNSGFCTISREKNFSTLSIIITFVKPGGNRESAFKILAALEKASQLAMLPSEGLRSMAYTPDLEEEWKWQRFWSLLLAKCFLLSLQGKNEGLLDQETKDAIITRWDAKLIEQSAYRYEALYRLIRKGFKYVQKLLSKDLINKTHWDIFFEIAREEIDFHFEIRISNFQQFLVDTWIPGWKELAEQKIDRKDLIPLLETQKLFHSQRLLEILTIFLKRAKKDLSLRGRLTAYFHESIELADLMVQALNARDSSGKIHKSEQWEDGKRSIAYNNRFI